MKKIVFATLGFVCLALGTIGIFLPILPTAPLYLVTLFCFTQSSDRLHDWFVSTNLYKKHLDSYVKKEGMTLDTKIKIVGMVTVLMAIGCFLMLRKEIYIPCIILLIVWIGHIWYFFFRVKTIPAKAN